VRFPRIIAYAWLTLLCAAATGHAENRVALVIGNDRYANLPASEQLQKAVNDAQAVGGALMQLGFNVVSGENVGRQALLARLDEAALKLTPGSTVFFFFSGHGVALGGVNYILPADVPAVGIGQIASLTGAAIREEDITDRFMNAGARVVIVVLDACRDNPFASPTRDIGRGLSPHGLPSGVFALYSAGRGQTALDRLYDGDRNPNSVFTRVLLPALARTDLDLPALAAEVRDEVVRLAQSVSHDQQPAYYDGTSGKIFLAGHGAPYVPPADPCSGPVTVSFPSRCAAPLTAAQERALKPRDSFRECGKCPEMVVAPAGSFMMGSPDGESGRVSTEGPRHRIDFAQPFSAGRYAVTFDEWDACTADGGCNAYRPDDEGWGRGRRPVINISWSDAEAYVAWLSRKTGSRYRLLSEAEREYIARAGTATTYWWGEAISHRQANYDKDSKTTLPVDSFEANLWGFFNVHGNVWEWTGDCWNERYDNSSDGRARHSGDCGQRIVRGGSWMVIDRGLRAAFRVHLEPDYRDNDVSLRVARDITQ
jgi:formylglycine-generating enzyme required for sulfatase activity